MLLDVHLGDVLLGMNCFVSCLGLRVVVCL